MSDTHEYDDIPCERMYAVLGELWRHTDSADILIAARMVRDAFEEATGGRRLPPDGSDVVPEKTEAFHILHGVQ